MYHRVRKKEAAQAKALCDAEVSAKLFLVGKIANKKNSLKDCVFVYSALEIQCHVVKNTPLQSVFSAMMPNGKWDS